jgi:DNA-binding NtrC family response regulator
MRARILLEHHEKVVRDIVCSMLTAAGYECRQTASPKKAMDILYSGEEFELLLLCDLCELLDAALVERMTEEFPDIPVVTLQLPFEREELQAVVRRTLEYHRPKVE